MPPGSPLRSWQLARRLFGHAAGYWPIHDPLVIKGQRIYDKYSMPKHAEKKAVPIFQ